MLNEEEVTSESQAEKVPKHKGAQAPNRQEEVTSESEEAPVQRGTQTPNLQEEVTSDSQAEIVQDPKAKAKPKPKQPEREQTNRIRGIQALEPVAGHAAQAVARHGAHVVRGVGLWRKGVFLDGKFRDFFERDS